MSGVVEPDRAAAILADAWRSGSLVKECDLVISTGTMSRPFSIATASAHVSAQFLGREFGFHIRSPA